MEKYFKFMSKTILIIGDSWGVPNYEGPDCGAYPSEHTEYRLREMGYKVYNCALNGGSNCRSIDLAKSYLKGEEVTLEPRYLINGYHEVNEPGCIDEANPQIDWIIWFHTEFFRGRFYEPGNAIEDSIRDCAHKNYEYASDFFKTQNARLAIIGGQSPVVTEILSKYIDPHFMIKDWRSEILGVKLPEVHTLSKVEWVEESSDTTEYKLALLEKHKIVMDAMRDKRKLFPDCCHPGRKPHDMLASKLHEVFEIYGERNE